MPSAKLAVAIGLSALSLSACGTTSKPEAGTSKAIANSQKGLDDPRKSAHRLPAAGAYRRAHLNRSRSPGGRCPDSRSAPAPSGPTVGFEPTPGAAQDIQIQGESQAAEVIGAALLYPNQASDSLLTTVEGCMALGVKG